MLGAEILPLYSATSISTVCATSGVAKGSTTLAWTLKPRTKSSLVRNAVPVPIGVEHQIHTHTRFVLNGHDIGIGVDVQHMAFRAQPYTIELAARPDASRDQ